MCHSFLAVSLRDVCQREHSLDVHMTPQVKGGGEEGVGVWSPVMRQLCAF